MRKKAVELSIFWLSTFGGLLLSSVAVSAGFGGQVALAAGSGFLGIVCFGILLVVQIRHGFNDANAKTPVAPGYQSRPAIGAETINSTIRATQRIRVDVVWRNTGQMVALNVRSCVRGKAVQSNERPPDNILPETNDGPPGILLPGANSTCPLTDGPIITMENMEALKNGQVSLWLICRIDYTDEEATPYSTSFLATYNATADIWEYRDSRFT
jgi:hypothetical protein